MRWRDVDGLRQRADHRLWDLDTGHEITSTEPGWVADKLPRVAAGSAAKREDTILRHERSPLTNPINMNSLRDVWVIPEMVPIRMNMSCKRNTGG
ncbi:hypothetical protein [Mycobacterium interjectum]|uniref:hypothetical protein n=1 Tax=Mycobacterium interjectum TaxID=33895 RepID=UPI000A4360BC|nr:hypothetical protein [Mycobacterium interjectum]MCV7088627.1 hypothetical protein [Mycobacterium interjectum]